MHIREEPQECVRASKTVSAPLRYTGARVCACFPRVSARSPIMFSWTPDVDSVTELNSNVERLTCLGGKISLDLPKCSILPRAGDRVRVQVLSSLQGIRSKNVLALHGSPLCVSKEDDATVVSCGGLLCRLPTALPEMSSVFIVASKCPRRRTR